MKKLITILLFSIFTVSVTYSQDKITFMTGKEIDVKIDTLTGDFIRYFKPNGKDKYIDSKSVFSVNYGDGSEKILYKQDIINGDDLTVPEARDFISGSQYAQKNYKPILPAVAGYGIGFVAGNYAGLFWGMLAPVGYTLTLSAKTPKLSSDTDKAFLDNENFVAGYQSKAADKKTAKAGLYSILGVLSGVLVRDLDVFQIK